MRSQADGARARSPRWIPSPTYSVPVVPRVPLLAVLPVLVVVVVVPVVPLVGLAVARGGVRGHHHLAPLPVDLALQAGPEAGLVGRLLPADYRRVVMYFGPVAVRTAVGAAVPGFAIVLVEDRPATP